MAYYEDFEFDSVYDEQWDDEEYATAGMGVFDSVYDVESDYEEYATAGMRVVFDSVSEEKSDDEEYATAGMRVVFDSVSEEKSDDEEFATTGIAVVLDSFSDEKSDYEEFFTAGTGDVFDSVSDEKSDDEEFATTGIAVVLDSFSDEKSDYEEFSTAGTGDVFDSVSDEKSDDEEFATTGIAVVLDSFSDEKSDYEELATAGMRVVFDSVSDEKSDDEEFATTGIAIVFDSFSDDESDDVHNGEEEEEEEEKEWEEEEEEEAEEEEEDDWDPDPTSDLVDETEKALSNLSMNKTTRRIAEKQEDGEGDLNSCETVEKLIKDGQVNKLKIDHCKAYLKQHRLRLTSKKDILLSRIKEHLELKDGNGEKKYPISSFTLNCKGDACLGDVVTFDQKVYETFNIASRRATGPPIGIRTVVGRIVNESYGEAKQQHTFTIEVLWSKGVKPLQPLHPLLIKGRNLYKLRTLRQKWDNEEEREKILQEKHERGDLARLSRERRIHEKEMSKTQEKIDCDTYPGAYGGPSAGAR